MAILFTDGFDYYTGTSSINGELIDVSSRYPVVSTNYLTYFNTFDPGYDGIGKSLRILPTGATANQLPIPGVNAFTKFVMGGHVYITNTTSSEREIFTVRTANGTWLALTTSTSSSTNYFSVRCSVNNTLGTDSRITNFSYAINTWYYVEFRAEIISDSSTINVQVYINGQIVLDKTGIAFSAGPYQWVNAYLGSPWLTTTSIAYRLDNFYMSDGEILGPINISTVTATSDTSFKNGIASSGSSNYLMVNDISLPSMDTNVFFASPGDIDQYEVGDISLLNPNDTVIGVQPLIFANVTRDITQRVTSSIVSSGSESTISTQPVLSVFSPTVVSPGVIRNDPATSTDWTVSGINNARLKITRTV